MDKKTINLNGYGKLEIKLEVNDHATPFIPRSYDKELKLCEYYYKIINLNGYGKLEIKIDFQNKRIDLGMDTANGYSSAELTVEKTKELINSLEIAIKEVER